MWCQHDGSGSKGGGLTVHQQSGFELACKRLFSGLDVPRGQLHLIRMKAWGEATR